jgi:hypothetical protein
MLYLRVDIICINESILMPYTPRAKRIKKYIMDSCLSKTTLRQKHVN